MPEWACFDTVVGLLRTYLRAVRESEDGYETETVLIIAVLVAAAVLAGGVVTALVVRKAGVLSGL